MKFLHLFTPRQSIRKEGVHGGLEKIVVDWYSLLEDDGNHYLYSFTEPGEFSEPIFKNHIVTPLKCGASTRLDALREDIQKLIEEKEIDFIINHCFGDSIKMAKLSHVLKPREGKILNILNIIHSNSQLLINMAPFITLKEFFSNEENYVNMNKENVNMIYTSSSAYSNFTFKNQLNRKGLDFDFYNFKGFFNVMDMQDHKYNKSDGSVSLIGRAVGLKRLPQTIRALKGFKGKIKVFTKYTKVNGVVEALQKLNNDQNYNIYIYIDAHRDLIFEELSKSKCLISGCPFESGPIIAIEASLLGVPAILAKNNNFDQKYGMQELLENVSHYSYNIDELKTNKSLLLDIVENIPEDDEFRKNIKVTSHNRLSSNKFKKYFYEMVEDVTKPENMNKFTN